MQAIHFNWSISRLVRWLVTAFVCTLLIFSSAPAFAAQSSLTKGETLLAEIERPEEEPEEESEEELTKGEEQLTEIEQKAQETTMEKPLSLQQTESETNPGLNEIQGTADVGEMKTPENSTTPGIEQRIKSALEKIQGKS